MSPNPFLKNNAILIDGNWLPAASGETVDITNPATGDTIGTAPNAGQADTAAAIAAAETAFQTWRHTTALERADLMFKLYEAIKDNTDTLAELLTLEQGKPLAEAKGEIGLSAAYIRWFAEEARRVYGDIIPSPFPDRQLQVIKQPVGVVAAITPWNFPSSMLSRKIGPALAAGCTSVIKPAIQTPFSGLAWGVLADMAGFPKGVINIVTGDAVPIGAEIMANKKVRKVTFTGSTKIGKLLIRQSADTVKRVSMELGGNAPFIIFDDADLDRAVDAAMLAKYRNSGQTCICTNRFLIQAGMYESFIEKFTNAVRKLNVGNGMDDNIQQGPLIDEAAVAKVEAIVADAKQKGGKIVTGGSRHALGGTFFEPTIIANVTSDMACVQEEIFGPVSPIQKFDTEEEAIQLANDTDYGLAAYFFTKDLGRAHRVAAALDYGLIGLNEGFITTEVAPFGGMKESGIGSEGSKYGIDEYLSKKYISIGGLAK